MTVAEVENAKKEAAFLKSLNHANIVRYTCPLTRVHWSLLTHPSGPMPRCDVFTYAPATWSRSWRRASCGKSVQSRWRRLLLVSPTSWRRDRSIVMGYADGGDLTQKIAEVKKAGKSFSEEEALDYFVQICLAMQHVHEKRILHRDLKCQV
jgi:serine/threonine protein kinase